MKSLSAALVAAFLLVLAGCTTTADLKILEIQDRAHERTVKFNDDSETRAARAWIEIQKEREKTRQLEAQAAITRAGAIMKIAEKADAGGRVAIARSLEERAPSGAAAAADVPVPRAALMPVPVIQPPKSTFDKITDVGVKGWALANDTAKLVLGYKSLGKQLDADVRRTQLAEEGQTARHAATTGAFTSFSNNQASQANESTRGFTAGLRALLNNGPDIVNNIEGNDNALLIGGGTLNNTRSTRNTVRCDQTQTARTGDGGQGGPGGTSTTGSGNNGAPGGNPAANSAQQTQPCNAGK